jgi:hypothetical protein
MGEKHPVPGQRNEDKTMRYTMTVSDLMRALSQYPEDAYIAIEAATNTGTEDEPDSDDLDMNPILGLNEYAPNFFGTTKPIITLVTWRNMTVLINDGDENATRFVPCEDEDEG